VTLQLDNPEVDRLAGELAWLEHVSPAEAVERALREWHQRLVDERAERDRRIRATLERIWALPVYDDRSPDEMLYDEDGNPK
jgi:hypothetical protein